MPEGIPQDMGFFEWIFQLGLPGIEGDPGYYARGEATEAEFRNLFTIATQQVNALEAGNPVKDQYFQFLEEQGAIEGDTSFYTGEDAAPGDFTNLINVASTFYAGEGGETGQVDQATGVLAGGQTIRVTTGDGIERYYEVYEFPPGSGQFMSFQYNNVEQARAAKGDFDLTTRSESWFNNNVFAEAPGEQVIGVSGTWQGLTREMMRDAAQAAGIRDPALVGRMASDPEMQQIMVKAIAGDWTQEQIRAEQRRTQFWQEDLYPGIQAFYGRTSDPEGAWANYVGNVSPWLERLGYQRGADGSFNQQVGEMLNSGIDAQTFLENAPVFMQAVQNRDFFEVLRQRSQQELNKDITFGDWFNLLKGEAAPEVQQVAEGAVVAYQAQQQGVGIEEDMLQRLIAERDLSEAQARTVFQEVNRAVLALGDTGLGRGDLTRDDIVSAMADIQSARGLNPEEIRQRVAKIARENDLFDEEKLQFFTGFTPQGTPFRPGLTALNPESA